MNKYLFDRNKKASFGEYLGTPDHDQNSDEAAFIEQQQQALDYYTQQSSNHDDDDVFQLELTPNYHDDDYDDDVVIQKQTKQKQQKKQREQRKPKKPLRKQPKKHQPSPVASSSTDPNTSRSRTLKAKKQRSAAATRKLLEQIELDNKAIASSSNGNRDHINMVVIGHVDAGKSTVMGHLLYLIGAVDQKTIHRFEQDSKRMGKASFKYAWVMDAQSEERERGVTIDVSVNFFTTKTKYVTLLDAPGHKDFVPNMISGAAQADLAVLVIDSTFGEFETGFSSGGQTKEHALLAKSLGISQMIVAVNKLDLCNWDETRFNSVVEQVKHFLTSGVGYSEQSLCFVPISGLTGENVVKRAKHPSPLATWYGKQDQPYSLLEAIDACKSPKRPSQKPFRLCIADSFKDKALGSVAAGKIQTGRVTSGDRLLMIPLYETCVVKALHANGNGVSYASAGDNVELGLTGMAKDRTIVTGTFLCDPEHPIPVVRRFQAQIITFELDIPILKGQEVMVHSQTNSESGYVNRLVALVNKGDGEVKKKKPRAIPSKASAIVEITTSRHICLELFTNFKALGRFLLREKGKTIAAGIVTKLIDQKIVHFSK
eukprot:CAMPEP_0201556812 /NCGR_PEP_ID=MMETSP0173_2-20130828/57888_1 /ASSEMBLY_ACC=CAM_ASM_000268 /TAXON_ID=218659 /ORGANISM="Vexillifera sp., Strain DIVA3 564/2" /LENGTH=598 /DNA_ID=CAMNT_0047969319 /DNA_START=21 /DNA_END=1817 /DNA_ORIENTATION=+